MTRKALLIGINRYRIAGADLRGCVNDVEDVRRVLDEFYGFKHEDITVLKDFDATKKAIQTELTKLLADSRRGDIRFLHYSGHGSNVPDTSGDEADHRDEILCPTDLDWKDPLLDDWLRSAFDGVPEGVNLTVVMDCCHSGSNTRAVTPPDSRDAIERFLPCPLDLLAVESGRELRGALRGSLRRGDVQGGGGDVTNVEIPEFLITGCRDDQTSADAFIDDDYHGALTHALVSALRNGDGKLTYRQLHAEATRTLAGGFSQVPQLEGRQAEFDREFLAPFER